MKVEITEFCYPFIFVDEDGNTFEHDVWAEDERQAISFADDYAWDNGYVDFYKGGNK